MLFLSGGLFLFVSICALFMGISDFSERAIVETIFLEIRLPRLLLVALSGATLSAAGVLSQALFRNPLASPSVLGASSGGVLGAILIYYFVSPWLHWCLLPAAAFAGTLITMLCVLGLSKNFCKGDHAHLLMCGFAMTTLLGAISSLVLSLLLTQGERAVSLLQWMMGGFNGRGWNYFLFALPSAFFGILFAFSVARKLDVLSLGEELASSLNIHVEKLQFVSVFAIALLVASSVSVAGALPFVSLMVPHITRFFTGPLNRNLLPYSLLNGMTLLVMADLLAQRLLYPKEIEVGTLTALIGVLFFFTILLRNKNEL